MFSLRKRNRQRGGVVEARREMEVAPRPCRWRAGRRTTTTTGLPEASASWSTSSATAGAGGFDTSTMTLTSGIAAQQVDALAERHCADLLRQVAAARADAVRHAAAELVDARRDLLQAGAGGRHDADGPAAHLVRKAQPDPADDGRAAVGAHDEQALLRSQPLQLDFFFDRDVIAEEEDVLVEVKRLAGDAARVAPCNRDQHETGLGEHLAGGFEGLGAIVLA